MAQSAGNVRVHASRLEERGYIEGQNLDFEFRWAEGKLDQLPELARELVGIPVDLIVTLAPPATVAARNATQTIPIVFVAIGEPVASGLVRQPRAAWREPDRDHPDVTRDERQTCRAAQSGRSLTL